MIEISFHVSIIRSTSRRWECDVEPGATRVCPPRCRGSQCLGKTEISSSGSTCRSSSEVVTWAPHWNWNLCTIHSYPGPMQYSHDTSASLQKALHHTMSQVSMSVFSQVVAIMIWFMIHNLWLLSDDIHQQSEQNLKVAIIKKILHPIRALQPPQKRKLFVQKIALTMLFSNTESCSTMTHDQNTKSKTKKPKLWNGNN